MVIVCAARRRLCHLFWQKISIAFHNGDEMNWRWTLSDLSIEGCSCRGHLLLRFVQRITIANALHKTTTKPVPLQPSDAKLYATIVLTWCLSVLALSYGVECGSSLTFHARWRDECIYISALNNVHVILLTCNDLFLDLVHNMHFRLLAVMKP